MKNIKIKTINYEGAIITVSSDGKTIIWNGNKRNIYLNSDGYAVCAIKLPNKSWRGISVARLVATAFIPNPNNLPEVNHKDYDRANADVDNLEWITHADNIRYSLCNRPDYSGSNNPNYGNRILSKRYAEDKQLAIDKQGRKGLQNGRCRPIALYCDGKLIRKFDYVKLLCEYLVDNKIFSSKSKLHSIEAVRSRVNACIRENKLYKERYSFEYI